MKSQLAKSKFEINNLWAQPPPTLWQLRQDGLLEKMLRFRETNILSNVTLIEASEISHVKRRLETVIGENRQLRTRLTQVNQLNGKK